jgi:Methylamine utilisation protein MauE
MDPLLTWIAAACIATLLAHAALAKLADRALFEQHLASFGVPMQLLAPLAWLLPLAEAAAAALLLTPWRGAGALLAATLLLLYAGAMARLRAAGRQPDCGCGGEPLPVSWPLVARNLLLAGIALVSAAPMASRALALFDVAVVAAALLLATLLYAALHQVLRHRARHALAFRRSS